MLQLMEKCSVWDVNSFTQLEKEHENRLNYQYTRLSVNTSNRTLLSYGPNKSSSKGNVSVGLDGGVSGVSYSFDIGGFVVNDLSSLSNKYGRWSFTQNIGVLLLPNKVRYEISFQNHKYGQIIGTLMLLLVLTLFAKLSLDQTQTSAGRKFFCRKFQKICR